MDMELELRVAALEKFALGMERGARDLEQRINALSFAVAILGSAIASSDPDDIDTIIDALVVFEQQANSDGGKPEFARQLRRTADDMRSMKK
jgi:hypothetical protein